MTIVPPVVRQSARKVAVLLDEYVVNVYVKGSLAAQFYLLLHTKALGGAVVVDDCAVLNLHALVKLIIFSYLSDLFLNSAHF